MVTYLPIKFHQLQLLLTCQLLIFMSNHLHIWYLHYIICFNLNNTPSFIVNICVKGKRLSWSDFIVSLFCLIAVRGRHINIQTDCILRDVICLSLMSQQSVYLCVLHMCVCVLMWGSEALMVISLASELGKYKKGVDV